MKLRSQSGPESGLFADAEASALMCRLRAARTSSTQEPPTTQSLPQTTRQILRRVQLHGRKAVVTISTARRCSVATSTHHIQAEKLGECFNHCCSI
eukprot:57638-Amphidinium_carterae.1